MFDLKNLQSSLKDKKSILESEIDQIDYQIEDFTTINNMRQLRNWLLNKKNNLETSIMQMKGMEIKKRRSPPRIILRKKQATKDLSMSYDNI